MHMQDIFTPFSDEFHRGNRLHYAVDSNDPIEVRQLLETGMFNINATTTKSYNTALHIATINNSLPIVQLLLFYGADVHAVNIDKDTPLHKCKHDNQLEILELLIEAGSRMEVENL
jgi:ankyrin repeat protein